MNSNNEIKILLESMKKLASLKGVSPKELLLCKELYSEIRILCLKEKPTTDKEQRMVKSGVNMTEANALLALKVRIKNLMENIL